MILQRPLPGLVKCFIQNLSYIKRSSGKTTSYLSSKAENQVASIRSVFLMVKSSTRCLLGSLGFLILFAAKYQSFVAAKHQSSFSVKYQRIRKIRKHGIDDLITPASVPFVSIREPCNTKAKGS